VVRLRTRLPGWGHLFGRGDWIFVEQVHADGKCVGVCRAGASECERGDTRQPGDVAVCTVEPLGCDGGENDELWLHFGGRTVGSSSGLFAPRYEMRHLSGVAADRGWRRREGRSDPSEASATTTLRVYAHLWPDADESTRAVVAGVPAARADSSRTSRSSSSQTRRSGA
jgi:hypothetical protein